MKNFLKLLTVSVLVASCALLAVSCNGQEELSENMKYEATITGEGTNIDMDGISTLIDSRRVDDFEACDRESDYVLVTVKDYGQFVITLRGDVAPDTVANFKALVSNGHYNSTIFNKVVSGYLTECGGYTVSDDGSFIEKEADLIKGEFGLNGHENKLRHVRGVVSMARDSADYDSAGSKFFIVHKTTVDSLKFDGSYAAFGFVVAGMDVVDAIVTCEAFGPENYKRPVNDIVVESMEFVQLKK